MAARFGRIGPLPLLSGQQIPSYARRPRCSMRKLFKTLRPCILWNDGRRRRIAGLLEKQAAGPPLRATTPNGNKARPAFNQPRSAWVSDATNEPERNFASHQLVCSRKAYCAWFLLAPTEAIPRIGLSRKHFSGIALAFDFVARGDGPEQGGDCPQTASSEQPACAVSVAREGLRAHEGQLRSRTGAPRVLGDKWGMTTKRTMIDGGAGDTKFGRRPSASARLRTGNRVLFRSRTAPGAVLCASRTDVSADNRGRRPQEGRCREHVLSPPIPRSGGDCRTVRLLSAESCLLGFFSRGFLQNLRSWDIWLDAPRPCGLHQRVFPLFVEGSCHIAGAKTDPPHDDSRGARPGSTGEARAPSHGTDRGRCAGP